MEEPFKNFLEWFGNIYSPVSARVYRSSLENFRRWFEGTNGEPLSADAVLTSDLRAYQDHLARLGRKPGTIKTQMKHVRAWLKFSGQKTAFPKPPTVQGGPPKALDRLAQRRLIRAVERGGKARDIALVRLLLSCGLRVSEAVSARVSDLDIGERHGVLTVRGKGNKYREVPVPPEARRALRAWLAEREKKHLSSDFIFPSQDGGRLTPRAAWDVVKKYSKAAGLRCSPHTLRHTAATNMIRAGTDIVAVAAFLGHANISTTAIYTKPSLESLMEAAERGEMV